MKKLAIAVALVCAATFANAAKVDWQIKSCKDGTYYVFNGNYADQIIAAFANEEIGGAAAFANLGLSVASDSTPAPTGAGGKSVAGSIASGVGDYLTYLVVKPSLTEGSDFGVISLSTAGYTYDGQDPSPGNLVWTYAKTGTIAKAAGPIPPEPIPEPTSGLLLLLGVAGMALRRRRA